MDGLRREMKILFKRACLNCRGDIEDDRLLLGIPCRRCLSDEEAEFIVRGGVEEEVLKELVAETLKKKGHLKGFKQVVLAHLGVKEFEDFFKRALGLPLWSSQRTWAKRVLLHKSFAIVAPTGVGKTVFGLAIAAFLASKGKRCYVIFPTTLLVEQAKNRLTQILSATGLNISLAYYSTALHKAEREEEIKKIKERKFDLLVTTSSFLARNFKLLKRNKFDFVFVDDVDAVLKSSRNIDRILILLGFKQKEVEEALSLVKQKVEVARLARQVKTEGHEHSEVAEQLELARSRLEELSQRVATITKRRAKRGVLVVSTATGRPRGLRVRLFRELLGFEVGSRSEAIRNVEDVFVKPSRPIEEEVVDLVRKLGGGGLVFVPLDRSVDYASKLTEALNAIGVRAELVHAKSRRRVIEGFSKKEIDVLVGMASYYGLLVRGIDLPERIRYAIFAGVPKMRFTLELKEAYPLRLLQLLVDLREALPQEEQAVALRLIGRIRRLLWRLTPTSFEELKKALSEGGEPPRWLKSAYLTIKEAVDFVIKSLSRSEVRERLKSITHLVLEEEEGRLKVTVPDVPTYIQASGRTSRMYAGGVSKGLSIVIVDDGRVFTGLVKQSRWLFDEVKWKPLTEVNLEEVVRQVDADRERIEKLRKEEVAEGFDPVKSMLLIVESPTKAKTIASLFGRPSIRRIDGLAVYEVGTGKYILNIVATKGHVVDLVTRAKDSIYGVKRVDGRFVPIYDSIKRCLSCGEQFVGARRCPYVACEGKRVSDSRDLISALCSLASEFDYVCLGTDPDTEGEKISWDVACLLKPYSGMLKRIEFHEVTRPALQRALEEPRGLNEGLVEANIVRRVEDRWIGFELSKRLWREFKIHTLSAGRVQTPVLGWVVKRFEEHERSRRTVLSVVLSSGFRFMLEDVPTGLSKQEVVKKLKGKTCRAVKLKEEVEEEAPPPPLTTDALLREASARLRIGAAEAMALAQDLFELGLITYHRTDSTRVSLTGRQIALEYIREKYGEELHQAREWTSEGAHECIRPTRPLDVDQLRTLIESEALPLTRRLTRNHYALYDLIFRRFVASQMVKAKVKRARLRLEVAEFSKEIEGVTEDVEPGFTKVYRPMWRYIPSVEKIDGAKVVEVSAKKVATVPLYTQGDLVALMKERGIGRPSTYAKIVNVLLERGYVKETKRGRLVPTRRGIQVYKYLANRFGALVSENRTAKLEALMYMVEKREVDYQKVLWEMYHEIKEIISSSKPHR
ncbi:MAG: reverse gyrase [Candidatus Nezhaarchaeota archaeon]|nr:reverse gyrase [Candidatus Nezhaarchaeota archaeon]